MVVRFSSITQICLKRPKRKLRKQKREKSIQRLRLTKIFLQVMTKRRWILIEIKNTLKINGLIFS